MSLKPLESLPLDIKAQGAAYLLHMYNSSEIFLFVQESMLLRLGLALILGCLVGFAHGYRHKDNVGFRTYGAVSVGSAAFAALSVFIYVTTGEGVSFQIISGVTTGVGFVCAAVIFKEGNLIRGLSTAATIWATAGIGAACGTGMPSIAIAVTIAMLIFQLLPTQIGVLYSED